MANEKDPYGIDPKTGGAKLDFGKSATFQGALAYFPRAIMEVAKVSQYGAGKYHWKGWEKVPDGYNRYSDAMVRHICKESIEGEWDLDAKNDPKYPGDVRHAAQAAWNALARLELILKDQEAK